ncbi:transcriptional repressor [Aquaspirillum soli]
MDAELYLQRAASHCTAQGSRLTPLRRKILQLALAQSGLIKAYQLLHCLQAERGLDNGVVAPPTIYRALDFLVAHGFLHRVDALNAYVVCPHFACEHDGIMLVCDHCGQVQEVDAAQSLSSLWQHCQQHGFQPHQRDLVLTGTCQQCQTA